MIPGFDDSPIDAAWASFEASWQAGHPPDIWEAISLISLLERKDVAVEFAMIDLEWRWRLSIDDQPRDFAHYIDMLKALQLESHHLVALVEHEFIVRSQWGDQPTVDAMLANLPADSGLRQVLEAALHENFPVCYRFRQPDGSLVGNSRHTVCLKFGRQRSDDPARFKLIEDDGFDRYVIADKEDTSIEEEHLEVERLSTQRFRVRPRSKWSVFSVGDQRLEPDQDNMLTAPFKIQFDDMQLSVECNF